MQRHKDDEQKEATKVSALLILLCKAYVKHRPSIASPEIPSTPVRVELPIHSMFAPPWACYMFSLTSSSVHNIDVFFLMSHSCPSVDILRLCFSLLAKWADISNSKFLLIRPAQILLPRSSWPSKTKKSMHARITARCPAFCRDGRGKRPIRQAGVWSRRSCFLPVNLKHGSIAARGNGLEYPTPQQSHAPGWNATEKLGLHRTLIDKWKQEMAMSYVSKF